MAFCQLGPYKLELLNSPTDWSFSESETWVSSPRIGGPPASQHLGRGLFRIEMQFTFSKLWNPSPEKSWINFLDLKRQGTPIQFFQGNGTNWGQVKIIDIDFDIQEARDGEPQIMSGSLTIEEYKK